MTAVPVPPTDLHTLRNAVYMAAATAAWLNSVTEAFADATAATDQYRDELKALVAEEEIRQRRAG